MRLCAGLLQDADLETTAVVTWRTGMLLYKAGCRSEPGSGPCVWLLQGWSEVEQERGSLRSVELTSVLPRNYRIRRAAQVLT